MYRDYLEPRQMERALEEMKIELAYIQENGTEDELISAMEDVAEMEALVREAWEDEEYDEDWY